eukprot:15315183-Heterocapsa_arctica.AAC.1
MEDYNAKVKAYDLEQVSSMTFDTKEMADAFFMRYIKMAKYTWIDPSEKSMELRVVRDGTFDERMRRQILWLLKDGIKKILMNKNKWAEWPEDKIQ